MFDFEALTDAIVRLVAEEIQPGAVDPPHLAIHIGDGHGVRDGFDQAGKKRDLFPRVSARRVNLTCSCSNFCK